MANYRGFEIRVRAGRQNGFAVFGPPDPAADGHKPLLFRCGSEEEARAKIDRMVDSPNPRRKV